MGFRVFCLVFYLIRCVRGGLLFSSSTHLLPPFLLPLPVPRVPSPPPATPWPPPPPPAPSRRPLPSSPIPPSPPLVARADASPPTARRSVLRCSTPPGVLARSTDPPGALSTGGGGTSSPSPPAASLPPMDRSHARTVPVDILYILLCMVGVVHVHAKAYTNSFPAPLIRKTPLNRPGTVPAAGLGRFSANRENRP